MRKSSTIVIFLTNFSSVDTFLHRILSSPSGVQGHAMLCPQDSLLNEHRDHMNAGAQTRVDQIQDKHPMHSLYYGSGFLSYVDTLVLFKLHQKALLIVEQY